MCVSTYFGEPGSREVAPVFELGMSVKEKQLLWFHKAVSYLFA